MSKFANMGKEELRAACRTAGISYGKLNNDGMRAALEAKTVATQVVTAEKGLTADEQAAKIARVTKVLASPAKSLLDLAADEASKAPAVQTNIGKSTAIEAGAASELKTRKAPKKVTERKVRAAANGVTKPSSGTICGQIWDALDAKRTELKGETPTFEHLRELAKAYDWQKNTAMTQYQRWKQFNGLMPRSLTV